MPIGAFAFLHISISNKRLNRFIRPLTAAGSVAARNVVPYFSCRLWGAGYTTYNQKIHFDQDTV